ncbi:hypothetical protein [Chitinophaga sp. S165]|uniref:hypothetical protein n=1 Tax=Chitinophaga sp. S165 TaxID=2135462 RepID=UPI000D710957|nr:hypothetical protein [Chitinophaga sp. S165]PWV56223.1 hypothetical protein C7475_101738 [Chitinophaga sp. S165]
MINVQREAAIPSALNTQEIQQYITDIQAYLANPAVGIKPTEPGTYRSSDLLEAFDRCFHSKCYLTEQKFLNSWCMDIEHFVSQSVDRSRRYDWTNLYPAEHRANKMKPRATPAGGYLDPCDPADDVETEILYSLGIMGEDPHFEPRDATNGKAVNTCELLNRLHNGHSEETIKATAGLRFEIRKKYDHIKDLLIQWLGCSNPVLKHQYKRQLEMHLSRKSSFTMLCRSMVAVLNHVPAEMLD